MTRLTKELCAQLQWVEVDGQDEFPDLLIKDIKKYIEKS